MVWVDWLTAQTWARYINKNHPLSDSSLVDAVMLHHAVSYDLALRHLDLNGKVNDEGVYDHYLKDNNISTLRYYQFRKKGEARNDHKVNTVCFWSKRLYNTFTQKLVLEVQFESSDGKSDAKDDSTKNTNIKEGGNYYNGQVAKPDVGTGHIPWDDVPQLFLSYSEEEEVTPAFLYVSALPEGTNIYYF